VSSQLDDHIAPINIYSQFWWGTTYLILLWIFANYRDLIWDNFSLLFLFFGALSVGFIWFVGVEAEQITPEEELKRVGLGFFMGLGGLVILFWAVGNIFSISSTLWAVPETPLAITLGGSTTAAAILLQFGVGTVEEGMFRVGFPRFFLQRGWNPFAIIFMVNMGFGLFHYTAYGGNLSGIVIAVVAGMIQALAYFHSKSAIGVMLGHTIWNLYVSGLLGNLFIVAWILTAIGAAYYAYIKKWHKKVGF
jgi:membrane protease YdiL (CAAX protease family)